MKLRSVKNEIHRPWGESWNGSKMHKEDRVFISTNLFQAKLDVVYNLDGWITDIYLDNLIANFQSTL